MEWDPKESWGEKLLTLGANNFPLLLYQLCTVKVFLEKFSSFFVN
jgi:hypothetical protein